MGRGSMALHAYGMLDEPPNHLAEVAVPMDCSAVDLSDTRQYSTNTHAVHTRRQLSMWERNEPFSHL